MDAMGRKPRTRRKRLPLGNLDSSLLNAAPSNSPSVARKRARLDAEDDAETANETLGPESIESLDTSIEIAGEAARQPKRDHAFWDAATAAFLQRPVPKDWSPMSEGTWMLLPSNFVNVPRQLLCKVIESNGGMTDTGHLYQEVRIVTHPGGVKMEDMRLLAQALSEFATVLSKEEAIAERAALKEEIATEKKLVNRVEIASLTIDMRFKDGDGEGIIFAITKANASSCYYQLNEYVVDDADKHLATLEYTNVRTLKWDSTSKKLDDGDEQACPMDVPSPEDAARLTAWIQWLQSAPSCESGSSSRSARVASSRTNGKDRYGSSFNANIVQVRSPGRSASASSSSASLAQCPRPHSGPRAKFHWMSHDTWMCGNIFCTCTSASESNNSCFTCVVCKSFHICTACHAELLAARACKLHSHSTYFRAPFNEKFECDECEDHQTSGRCDLETPCYSSKCTCPFDVCAKCFNAKLMKESDLKRAGARRAAAVERKQAAERKRTQMKKAPKMNDRVAFRGFSAIISGTIVGVHHDDKGIFYDVKIGSDTVERVPFSRVRAQDAARSSSSASSSSSSSFSSASFSASAASDAADGWASLERSGFVVPSTCRMRFFWRPPKSCLTSTTSDRRLYAKSCESERHFGFFIRHDERTLSRELIDRGSPFRMQFAVPPAANDSGPPSLVWVDCIAQSLPQQTGAMGYRTAAADPRDQKLHSDIRRAGVEFKLSQLPQRGLADMWQRPETECWNRESYLASLPASPERDAFLRALVLDCCTFAYRRSKSMRTKADGLLKLVLRNYPGAASACCQFGRQSSALHFAAQSCSEQMDCVKLLLCALTHSGGDRARTLAAQNRNQYGETPLHYAAENGSLELVELLLMCGADPNALDDGGRTPAEWIDAFVATKPDPSFAQGFAPVLELLRSGAAAPNSSERDEWVFRALELAPPSTEALQPQPQPQPQQQQASPEIAIARLRMELAQVKMELERSRREIALASSQQPPAAAAAAAAGDAAGLQMVVYDDDLKRCDNGSVLSEESARHLVLLHERGFNRDASCLWGGGLTREPIPSYLKLLRDRLADPDLRFDFLCILYDGGEMVAMRTVFRKVVDDDEQVWELCDGCAYPSGNGYGAAHLAAFARWSMKRGAADGEKRNLYIEVMKTRKYKGSRRLCTSFDREGIQFREIRGGSGEYCRYISYRKRDGASVRYVADRADRIEAL